MPSREERRQQYLDKLKDPRWQQLRLRVFERDGWACRWCGSKQDTLVGHHLQYIAGREPWEYPPEMILTLCWGCHQEEHELRANEESSLLAALKANAWNSGSLRCLTVVVQNLGPMSQDDWMDLLVGISSPALRARLISAVRERNSKG